MDRLQEGLQDHVPLVHGDHLVDLQTTLRQGPGIQRSKGNVKITGVSSHIVLESLQIHVDTDFFIFTIMIMNKGKQNFHENSPKALSLHWSFTDLCDN